MASRSQKVRALEDIWEFCDLIKFKGGRESFFQIHFEVAEFITRPQFYPNPEYRRRLLFLPREHRKSTVGAVLNTLWRTYRNPNLRINLGANEKKLSQSFIRELRQYYDNKELQEEVWNNRPHIKGPMIPALAKERQMRRRLALEAGDTEAEDRKVIWSNSQLQFLRHDGYVAKEVSINSCSVGQTQTGDHYDIVILDDIVDFKNSKTLQLAEKVETFASDLESVLTKKSTWQQIAGDFGENVGDELIIIGTPYYRHDYYASTFFGDGSEETLRKNCEFLDYSYFKKNIYVNGKNSEDGYIFPEEFDDIIVGRLKRRIKKSRVFAAQYLLIIKEVEEGEGLDSSKVNILPENCVKRVPYSSVACVCMNGLEIPVRLHLAIDLAASLGPKANHSVVGVGGLDENYNFYLFDLKGGRYKPSEFIKIVLAMAEKWGISLINYEIGGYQETFAHNLLDYVREHKKPPVIVNSIYHKGEKKDRIVTGIEPYISNGKFYTFGFIKNHTPLFEEIDMLPADFTDDYVDVAEMIISKSTRTQKNVMNRGRGSQGRHTTINKVYGGSR